MFAVCGLASAIQSNMIIVIVALGQPRANTMMSAGMLVIYFPLIVWFSLRNGALGAAWVHMIMSVVVLIPLHIVFFRITGVSRAAYVGALFRPVTAALAMAGVLRGLALFVVPAVSGLPLLSMIFQVLSGAVVYCSVVLVLWHFAGRPAHSAESDILHKLAQRVPALKSMLA
jgi:hypothetical protein